MNRIAPALPLLAATLAACEPYAEPEVTGELPPCDWATVTRVVDGDTVHVDLHGEDETVRYLGIDTTELPAEPYAAAATERNAQLVDGRQVCLETDTRDRDQFGRLLRYVWLPDGTFVNRTIVREGLACSIAYRPDTARQSQLDRAEDAAIAEGAGLWAPGVEAPCAR